MKGAKAVGVAVAVGGAFTVGMAVLPTLPLAVQEPALRAAMETTAGWVGLTAAVLFLGRVRRRGQRQGLLLVLALGLSGLTNLLLAALPAVLGGATASAISTWGALCGRVLASGLFAAAALGPDRPLGHRLPVGRVVAALPLLVVAIAAVTGLLAAELPEAVRVATDDSTGFLAAVRDPVIHPVLAMAQLLMALAYAAAAAGFLRRGHAADDPLLVALAAASVFACFARLHYLFLPSLYADVVSTGDVLRLGFYVLLLVGVGTELRATWRALPTEAAARERARIARDLHDGLAQELAFIAAQSSWLSKHRPEDTRVRLLASASRRALDESRRAVDFLSATGPTSAAAALTRAVTDVGDRHRVQVRCQVDADPQPQGDVLEQLVRLAREAAGNAARHANATLITVDLAGGEGLVLEVRDDGAGFDADRAVNDGSRFGLRSMRERVEAMGGTMMITSGAGDGTVVRFEVPWTR